MARGSSSSDLRKSRGIPEGYEFRERSASSSGFGTPLVEIEQVGIDRSDKRNNPVTNAARNGLNRGFPDSKPGSMMPKAGKGSKTLQPDEVLGNFGVYQDGNIFRDLEVLHPALYKQMEGKGLSETISKDLMEEARSEARLAAGYRAGTRGQKSGEIYVASPEYKIPPTTAIDTRNGERNRYAGGNVRFTQKIEWRVAAGSDPRAENPTIEFLHGWEIQGRNGPRVQVWETEPPRFSSRSSEKNVVVETRRGR